MQVPVNMAIRVVCISVLYSDQPTYMYSNGCHVGGQIGPPSGNVVPITITIKIVVISVLYILINLLRRGIIVAT